jgi:L-rhamnose mutarotase
MARIAFTMQLNRGCKDEYKKRHDEIWPELTILLHEAGVHEYSIFLDEKSYTLFAFLKTETPEAMNILPAKPVMQKWWEYMKDLMATNADNSPVSGSLEEVFFMP